MDFLFHTSKLVIILLLTVQIIFANVPSANYASTDSVASFNRSSFKLDPREHDDFGINIENEMRVRRGSSNRPNGTNEIRILIAQVNEMKAEISRLQNSSYASSGDKMRIATLETELEDAKNALDAAERENRQATEHLTQFVQNLQSEVNNLKRRLNESERRLLPHDCVDDIKDRRFTAAEKKLEQLEHKNGDVESKIREIIHAVYNGRVENFNLIMDFIGKLQNLDFKCLVCKALQLESEDTNNNVDKPIALARIVKTEIIESQHVKSDTKATARRVLNSLYDRIKDLGAGAMRDAMLSNQTAFEVSTEVHNVDESVSGAMVEKFVSDVYRQMRTNEILQFIKNLPHAEQHIAGCNAVLDEMKRSNQLHTDAVVHLANYIRYMREQRPNTGNQLNVLKAQLPKSASALAFADEVCIKSKLKGGYLYLSTVGTSRKVLVSKSNGLETNGRWRVEGDGFDLGFEGFRFKNVNYNEYLSGVENPHPHKDWSNSNIYIATTVAGEPSALAYGHSNFQWRIQYLPDDSVQMLFRRLALAVGNNYDHDWYETGIVNHFCDYSLEPYCSDCHWFIEEC